MNPLKKLARQTAVYGLSSIIGRVLNYLLVPIYTRVFAPEAYGVVTELYAVAGFLMVLFAYGMETTFFRFAAKERDPGKVYGTAFLSMTISTLVLCAAGIGFSANIAATMGYADHPEYIVWFLCILGADALVAIPFARLRFRHKATHYAILKLINIGLNISLNLFFLKACPMILGSDSWSAWHDMIHTVYDPDMGVGYIFIANLAASGLTLLLLLPNIVAGPFHFDPLLWRKMIRYGLPLMIAGFAGIVNEMLDRILLKYLLPYDLNTNMAYIGIYGACYKLSVLMTLFVQAFRLGAEPFFFQKQTDPDARQTYALTLKYFVLAGCGLFLVIMLFLDFFKHFIGSAYHEGLNIVPILLMANLMLGIYFNLSVWYKLTDRTGWGAGIACLGAGITIVLNIYLIPLMGYTGAAWATLCCYLAMVLISGYFGHKYYPIDYNLKKILFFLILSIVIFWLSEYLRPLLGGYWWVVNVLFLALYFGMAGIELRKDKFVP